MLLFVQQGQEAAAAAQSDAEPRQVRSRWAEHLDPLIICSNYSPSQVEEEEEEEAGEEGEEEGDFHPQSLESLLEGEVEVSSAMTDPVILNQESGSSLTLCHLGAAESR